VGKGKTLVLVLAALRLLLPPGLKSALVAAQGTQREEEEQRKVQTYVCSLWSQYRQCSPSV
jgi:hypothetical protein